MTLTAYPQLPHQSTETNMAHSQGVCEVWRVTSVEVSAQDLPHGRGSVG